MMNRRKLEIKFVTELCNYNLGEMKILLDACVNYAMFSSLDGKSVVEIFNENMIKAMKTFLINSPLLA